MKQRIALVGGILCVHPVCGLEMATQMISFQLKEERGEEGGVERKSERASRDVACYQTLVRTRTRCFNPNTC